MVTLLAAAPLRVVDAVTGVTVVLVVSRGILFVTEDPVVACPLMPVADPAGATKLTEP